MNSADPSPNPDPPAAGRALGGHAVAWVLLVGAALAWRLVIAANMPAIARDGVQFCWHARDLGREGVALLRTERYPQHPAFPTLTLAVQRGLRAAGWTNEPLTWQAAGQSVALASGLAVVVLTGVLTHALVRRLVALDDGQSDPCAPRPAHDRARRAGLIAAAMAALLPLNVWLSVDVMSDQMHAAFYLAGALAMLSAMSLRGALFAGLCGGFAFLTRPEGAAVWLATVLLIAAQVVRPSDARHAGAARRHAAPAGAPRTPTAGTTPEAGESSNRLGLRGALVRIAAATLAFAACAAPYWLLTGSLSAKLEKESVEQFLPAEPEPVATPSPAALLREDVPPHLLVPRTLYETGRAGRVVVPLLAVVTLVGLRRRLARPPVLGLLLCMAIHFALSAWNLHHAGYLDPRHTLVVVALLTPFAAAALAQAFAFALRRGRRWLGVGLIALSLLPLAAYAARIPNMDAAVLREAARVVCASDPKAAQRLLLGGSSQKRIAFYANLRFQAWPENEPEWEARYAALRDHVLHFRPDYFAIETGRGREVAENERLLERLTGDSEVRAAAAEFRVATVAGAASAVKLVEFRWREAQ